MASKSLRKKIARRIAAAERIIQISNDKQAVESAKNEIMRLTSEYELNLTDIMEIDDMVQEILKR